jgi:RNA polymerase sigma-70 factor (ECF subfamily)
VSAVDDLARLVSAAREGDDRAAGELVRRTQPAVWRLCSLLGSRGEEEDLVQEVYARALRGLGSLRTDDAVVPWLLRIARHVCADDVRRRERRRRLAQRLRAQPTDPAPPPDDVASLLVGLAPDRREAFVLTQVLGLSYEEAAVAMECPVGTIRSRVARARADLFAAVRAAEASS